MSTLSKKFSGNFSRGAYATWPRPAKTKKTPPNLPRPAQKTPARRAGEGAERARSASVWGALWCPWWPGPALRLSPPAQPTGWALRRSVAFCRGLAGRPARSFRQAQRAQSVPAQPSRGTICSPRAQPSPFCSLAQPRASQQAQPPVNLAQFRAHRGPRWAQQALRPAQPPHSPTPAPTAARWARRRTNRRGPPTAQAVSSLSGMSETMLGRRWPVWGA